MPIFDDLTHFSNGYFQSYNHGDISRSIQLYLLHERVLSGYVVQKQLALAYSKHCVVDVVVVTSMLGVSICCFNNVHAMLLTYTTQHIECSKLKYQSICHAVLL